MKALGIIRKIDDLGRIVIPKEVRRVQGWGEGQPMEMFMDGTSLVIREYGAEQAKANVIEGLMEVLEMLPEIGSEKVKDAIVFLKK